MAPSVEPRDAVVVESLANAERNLIGDDDDVVGVGVELLERAAQAGGVARERHGARIGERLALAADRRLEQRRGERVVGLRLLVAAAIALGTIGGGWKIMKTLGRRIFPIKPIDSLDSQIASSVTILLSTAAGAPVSSTQVVASSVMGVGAGERAKMVQWSVGKHMVVSWMLTIPASATLAALIFNILRLLFSP